MEFLIAIGNLPKPFISIFILLLLTSTTVYTQSSDDDDNTFRKNHLSGIRPIRLTHPIAKPLESSIIIDDTRRSNVRRHRVKTSVNTVATGSFKNRLLNAVKEALSDYDDSSQQLRSLYMDSPERLRYSLPQVVTPAVPKSTNNNTLATLRQPVLVETSVNHADNAELVEISTDATNNDQTIQQDDSEEAKRRARIQARWRKLGPLVKSLNFPHIGRNTNDMIRSGAEQDTVSNTVRKIVRERLRQLSSRTHSLTNRPLFNGPILANGDTTTDIEDKTLVNSVSHEREYVRNEWHSDSSLYSQRSLSLSNNITTTTLSSIIDTFASSDYHYRTIAPIKKYKFTQKLRQRPRLRIRKPGETQQIRGNRTAIAANPLALPMLTPFASDGDSIRGGGNRRPPWSSHESITGNDEVSRIDERNEESGQDSGRFGGRSISQFGSDNTRFSGGIGSSNRESGKPTWSGRESNGGRFGGGKFGIGNKEISENSGELNGGDDGFGGNGDGNGESSAGFGGENDSFGGGSGKFGGGSGGFGGGSSGTSGGAQPPIDFGIESFGLNGPNIHVSTELPPIESSLKSSKSMKSMEGVTSSSTNNAPALKVRMEEFVIPQNSGLRSVAPPAEFQDGFGSSRGGSNLWSATSFGGGSTFGGRSGSSSFNSLPDGDATDSITPLESQNLGPSQPNESIFTGESALTPNRNGPTGDGFGPPLFPGAAVPPPVPAISLGGDAAGLPPYHIDNAVRNPPSTVKPSALLSVLNKADLGFNQAINHFEQGTPLESAAIDILEVALGSQKLDSQAKLLGHVDRTIGIDNLQRLQRWANTGGALDAIKEQFVKIAKNYSPPENLLPTIPPQFNYLFTPTGKR